MTQHSKAPWHLSPTHYGKAYDIGAADGDNVALIYGPEMNGSDFFKANALLIAAAPELLDALNYLEDAASSLEATFGYIREDYPERSAIHTHEGHTEAYLSEMIKKARAAIAKAEGRAP